jgi:hypothetical protein
MKEDPSTINGLGPEEFKAWVSHKLWNEVICFCRPDPRQNDGVRSQIVIRELTHPIAFLVSRSRENDEDFETVRDYVCGSLTEKLQFEWCSFRGLPLPPKKSGE